MTGKEQQDKERETTEKESKRNTDAGFNQPQKRWENVVNISVKAAEIRKGRFC